METKVKFHLPGLRYNYPLNMLVLSLMKQHPEYFREDLEYLKNNRGRNEL